MSKDSDHVKAHIELAIERAREGVTEKIDALDGRLRDSLDFRQIASDHAPQLMAVGAAVGFLVGFGVPKVMARTIQLGVPLVLAVQVMKRRRRAALASPDLGHS